MKDSKEYSKKVRKLYRSLKRRHGKIQKALYDEPTDALVYAAISEKMDEAAARAAIKRFDDYFIDWNELRVSRVEEIVELLGQDSPATREIAEAVTKALQAVYHKYNTVSLKALKKLGKRPARRVLEKMDVIGRFIINYCMLTSRRAHAIPLTEKMIDYLRSNQLVHPDADDEQIEAFLTKQISAENAYEFYALLRRESESRRRSKKKKKTTRRVKKKRTTRTRK